MAIEWSWEEAQIFIAYLTLLLLQIKQQTNLGILYQLAVLLLSGEEQRFNDRRAPMRWFPMFLFALTAGCAVSPSQSTTDRARLSEITQARSLPGTTFEVLGQGDLNSLDLPKTPVHELINSQAELDAFLAKSGAAFPKPLDTDFTTSSLLFVSDGQKATTGYELEALTLADTDACLTATLAEWVPEVGGATLEHPVLAIRFAKHQKPVCEPRVLAAPKRLKGST